MRLVEVDIENYKQYAGKHTFRPGEKAMVAIIGQNGAGKTTLFEAIEWCLYNPSRIKNDTLIPRVQGGKPRVRVVLEDPHSGVVYEIERMLKGGSTQAEIYRQDQPESPLVQGTRQVTEYVATELTGLSHTAFVSTFFTRQKELSFFGDLGATQRREQVGRLLGLETIRVAQKRIGEQRTRRQAEARVKREQYEEQTRGHDFPGERAQLGSVIDEQTGQRDAARVVERACKEQTALASAARDLAQQRYAANAELRQAMERVLGEGRRFEEMRQTAQRELAAIAEASVEIERQQIQAAQEPVLLAALARHETEKQKSETAERLAADLRELLSERQAAVFVLPAVRVTPIDTVAGAAASIGEFDAELGRLDRIDLEGLRTRKDTAKQLMTLEQNRTNARAKLESMEKLAGELITQIERFSQGGLPAERLQAVQSERAAKLQSATAALSVAEQTEIRGNQLRTLERSLRDRAFGERCPTCARPFQPGEAVETLAALAEQIGLLEEEIAAERRSGEALLEQAKQLAANEAALASEADEYQKLSARLETGRGMIEEQRRDVAMIELELGRCLREAGRRELPDQAEIDGLEAELQLGEVECRRRPSLELGRERLRSSIQRQETIERQSAELGTIAYDLDAHNRDYVAWTLARDAVARIEELRKQVALRPERETTMAQAAAHLADIAGERQQLEGELVALAFDPAEVDDANQQMRDALESERSATGSAHLAEKALIAAQRARDDLDKLENQLKTLADESAAAEIATIELQRAYNEFARFEQFVAMAVTPVLSEIASQLLEKATGGKYDRLEFTEDYGIEVYDGDDDRFPLGQYSGGERDVIALCARLALSQIIGGQATTPIEFMVLDEVFGSLDVDRRRDLMEMLHRLMEENRAFQQLFVISHVDDVRAASMFDEVWRVSESPDGVSQLEQVSVTGTLEDY